jgi:hypothetical protein
MCKPFLRLIALARIQIFTSPDPPPPQMSLSLNLKNKPWVYTKMLFKNSHQILTQIAMDGFQSISLELKGNKTVAMLVTNSMKDNAILWLLCRRIDVKCNQILYTLEIWAKIYYKQCQ